MIRKIVQEDPLGCGVACVASVLNSTYKKTLRENRNKAKTEGFLCKDLINILKQGNKEYSYHYINSKVKRKIYKDKTIVFIKRSEKYPSGHYLCRINNKWMDPWINFNESQDVSNAKAGFRKRLPGKPIYALIEK